MTPEALAKRILAAREFAVPLDEKKQVTARRPAETQVLEMFKSSGEGKMTLRVGLEDVKRHVVGWAGFTEADLIPSGASDPVEFSQEVFALWVEDNRDAVNKIAQAILDKVIEHEKQAEEAEKN